MNFRFMLFLLGEIIFIVGVLMCVPMFMSLGYHEAPMVTISFAISIAIAFAMGIVGFLLRPKKQDRSMNPAAGFVVCGLAWILIALIGAIPYRVSGNVPHFVDALFETISGFTTTGSSIIADVEAMPKSLLFWRALTQWIGGMGVLVFVIAILPKSDKMSTALAKAEIPGPQFGKLVSKLGFTSRILYMLYIGMTLLLVAILCAQKMPVFDSFCHAFTTASTGGFSVKNDSILAYNSVGIEVTITVFMMLFSINFNVFFMIVIGHVLKALKNEEMIWLIIIYIGTTLLITISLSIGNAHNYPSFAQALRYSSFQTASFMSTTGFSTADQTLWPSGAQALLMCMMLIGGCSGSTAGGIKVSRVLLVSKYSLNNIRKSISPRRVLNIKLENKVVDENTLRNVMAFFALYFIVLILSTLLVSINSPYNTESNFTGVLTCVSNVGPAFGSLSEGNFAGYGIWAKLVFCFDMLLGRLELLPILMLFFPRAWKKL